MLLQNRLQKYRGSPASSIDEQVRQLTKGAQQIAYNMVLVQEEMGQLRDAIEALTKRKSCKRQYIRTGETLTVSKVSKLIAAKEGSSCNNSKTPAKRVCKERHCGCCRETRHNSRTCKVEIEDVDNSDASE